MSQTLIVGASSLIAKKLIDELLKDDGTQRVYAVSRSEAYVQHDNLNWFQSAYDEASIKDITAKLISDGAQLSKVIICNGLLHNEGVFPEKRLEDLNATSFQSVLETNTLIPMLWIKHLKPLLKGKRDCIVAVFSARVGSIEDNQLGGWYAYRASKAALNMMLKNASIEYSRIAKQTRFLVFHPGTTDTPLSKPFQKNVPEDKLFTPEFVASQLLKTIGSLPKAAGIDYLDWEGKRIAW